MVPQEGGLSSTRRPARQGAHEVLHILRGLEKAEGEASRLNGEGLWMEPCFVLWMWLSDWAAFPAVDGHHRHQNVQSDRWMSCSLL